MSAAGRYGLRGRVVESHARGGLDALVLSGAASDGQRSEFWVEVRHAGKVLAELRGRGQAWMLEEARKAAKFALSGMPA